MDKPSLANVEWSPTVNSRFEVVRLQKLHNREPPDDHDPSQPHRLHFHALILFTHGQGTHGVDFIEYPVKAGTLVHVCANQTHHFCPAQALDAFMVVFLPTALPTNRLLKDPLMLILLSPAKNLNFDAAPDALPATTLLRVGSITSPVASRVMSLMRLPCGWLTSMR